MKIRFNNTQLVKKIKQCVMIKDYRIKYLRKCNNTLSNKNEIQYLKKQHDSSNIRGDVRLRLGNYYTSEEADEYIEKSLKRKLP